jgi:hypothetical protein
MTLFFRLPRQLLHPEKDSWFVTKPQPCLLSHKIELFCGLNWLRNASLKHPIQLNEA